MAFPQFKELSKQSRVSTSAVRAWATPFSSPSEEMLDRRLTSNYCTSLRLEDIESALYPSISNINSIETTVYEIKSDLTFWDHPNWTGKGNYVNPPDSLEPKRAAHSCASRAMTRSQSQGFWCQSVQLLSGSEQSNPAASRTDWPIVGRRSDGFGRDALAAEPMVRPKKCGKMSYQSEPKGAN